MINKVFSLLKITYETILELIYPERGICFICDTYDEGVGEDHICSDCKDKLIFVGDNICRICGKPLGADSLGQRCKHCIKHPHYFSRAIAPLIYDGEIKQTIYTFKYGNKPYIYKALGPIMVQAIIKDNIDNIDMIIPVPLHKSKLMKRGFNQSELLARYISKELDIPMYPKGLIRRRKTAVQNKLHRIERIDNVKDAFIAKKPNLFIDKKVLLIDDIYTTGSTCDECSRIILEAGARDVVVLTLATGGKN